MFYLKSLLLQEFLDETNLIRPNTTLIFPRRIIAHHPKAGLNPLADAAGYLFSIVGRLKYAHQTIDFNLIQKELIQEIRLFQEAIQHHHYQKECLMVSHYVICAFIDDMMACAISDGQRQWQPYSLLTYFNQDTQHEDKFFDILEKITQDPAHYIDLMEFMYICLSLGYRGPYRATQQAQYQLDQMTSRLYKHIKVHRGNVSHTLSPNHPKKSPAKKTHLSKSNYTAPSLLLLFLITSSIIMTIFIGLGILVNTKGASLQLNATSTTVENR